MQMQLTEKFRKEFFRHAVPARSLLVMDISQVDDIIAYCTFRQNLSPWRSLNEEV